MLFTKLLLATASFTTLVSAQVSVVVREGTDSVDAVDAVLTLDEENGMVHVEMTAARQGYLAFGFSLDTFMADTVIVVGLPDDGTVRKRVATSYSDPEESASQTLQDVSISQNDTHTTMSFSKLLEEEGEPTVNLAGTNNIFLYALGSSNEFGYHGTDRGSFELDFANDSAIVKEVKTYQGLWMAHGFLMAISWALLIPIGVGVSVFRSFVPGGGTWFKLHRTLNGTGLLMMIAGFFIAFYIIQDQGLQHFSTEIPHRLTGLFITLFGFAQGLWGIFRPHAPHAPAPTGGDNKADGEQIVEKTQARSAFEYGHRILGVGLLAAAWFNTSLGLDLFSARFATQDLSLAMWVVVALLAAVTVGLGVKQRL